MNAWCNPPTALLAAALFSSSLAAATHEVAVNNNFFSPNDLTIQVGDTVRWTNPSGAPPNSHDVTADDASFASITAPSFVFEHTFNSVGEVLYYCTVHSMPGRDRNQFMNGRIVVQTAVPAPTFTINAGLNDSWFNPATSGQGFFITVFPDLQKMFLAWFTYETERPPPDVTAMLGEPGHRWITAFGDYAGDTAVLDIDITQGGVFDSPAPAPTHNPGGTIVVKFTSCNAGEVMYDIPSIMRSGTVPIERIALDNVPACEAAEQAAP